MPEDFIKHEWARDEDGEIEDFDPGIGYHSGPKCLRCGWTFCDSCFPEGLDEPCDEQTPYLF